jgi:DNA-binding NtrC family response regulator
MDLTITQDALDALHQHPLDGNVRELAARIEQAVMLSPHNCQDITSAALSFNSETQTRPRIFLNEQIADFEASLLSNAFSQCGKNVKNCSDMLGVHKKTLIRKLKRYALYEHPA